MIALDDMDHSTACGLQAGVRAPDGLGRQGRLPGRAAWGNVDDRGSSRLIGQTARIEPRCSEPDSATLCRRGVATRRGGWREAAIISSYRELRIRKVVFSLSKVFWTLLPRGWGCPRLELALFWDRAPSDQIV